MHYEYYQDDARQWRWTAYAANHEAVAVSSEAYVNERDCLNAIGLLKRSGGAPVRKR